MPVLWRLSVEVFRVQNGFSARARSILGSDGARRCSLIPSKSFMPHHGLWHALFDDLTHLLHRDVIMKPLDYSWRDLWVPFRRGPFGVYDFYRFQVSVVDHGLQPRRPHFEANGHAPVFGRACQRTFSQVCTAAVS